MKIKEIIVVEGRDDTAAIRKSLEAITIETHGYGIIDDVWKTIEKAYRGPGIIIFTDPDTAGEQIRARLTKRFPKAKQAFLPKAEAIAGNDIGVENASPESIRNALNKAKCTLEENIKTFNMQDLVANTLVGGVDASKRRNELGKRLGIGEANAKTFLNRINKFGITREEFNEIICTINN